MAPKADKIILPEKLFAPDTADAIVQKLHLQLVSRMQNPIFFVMPVLTGIPEMVARCEVVGKAFSSFQKKGMLVPSIELRLSAESLLKEQVGDLSGVYFHCWAVDSRSVEGVRDLIKETLWPVWVFNSDNFEHELCNNDKINTLKGLISILSQAETVSGTVKPQRRLLSLDNHGYFFPSSKAATKDMPVVSFDHGGGHFYRFRRSQRKVGSLPVEFENLRYYLNDLPKCCPNHFFRSGPRMSAVDWPVIIPSCVVPEHSLIEFARMGLKQARYKGAHDNVEVNCIENDPASIAVEVPVWIEPGELNAFSLLFKPDQPLTGHIDLMRCSGGKIEIWDYKPEAAQEKRAALQVLLYAIATSIRTEIPLSYFHCGFFDVTDAFEFVPSKLNI